MITVKDLRFSYPGNDAPTIRGVDFHVHKGEVFGLLGPSGSGKSTIQKLLIGLLKGYTGSIDILGKDAGAWGTEIYQEMGVGFELPNNFSQLTGLENLQLFSSLYGKTTLEPMKALEMMDLQEAAKQRVKNYSKGMMMRLNFVRSILHDPQLLFLDEPTAGLDPVNARKLKDIVLSLKEQGKTVFLTTHRMEDADELCDRIAFIVEGELKLIDTPRNLKLQHGQKVVEVEHRLDGERVQESFALEALNQDERFRQILDSGTLETIHSQEASLEDVFIKTTGRTLV
jgi:fluoroquinolone transport system ATP-binding protein